LEDTCRASEFNVEILKDKIDNLNEEMSLLKKHSEKQKRFIHVLKQRLESLSVDLSHYKQQAALVGKTKKSGGLASQRNSFANDLKEGNRLNTSLNNIHIDLNDSLIFKDSPLKFDAIPSKRHESKSKTSVAHQETQADEFLSMTLLSQKEAEIE
jgi:hypothetical protein